MIKNNKGFMLIEVIVVSTIVVTTMIALYVSFNKLYNNYRIKNSYYNLDAMYATKEMVDSMLESKIEKNNINNYISSIFSVQDYDYVIENNKCTESLMQSSCSVIQELYKVNNMIFTKYDLNILNSLKGTVINQTFKDYIDYIITYYDIKNSSSDYDYIILTETKNKENNYYANLRIR